MHLVLVLTVAACLYVLGMIVLALAAILGSEWVFGKARAKGFPDLSFRCIAQVEHPRSGREVGHRFKVPYDYRLLRHD